MIDNSSCALSLICNPEVELSQNKAFWAWVRFCLPFPAKLPWFRTLWVSSHLLMRTLKVRAGTVFWVWFECEGPNLLGSRGVLADRNGGHTSFHAAPPPVPLNQLPAQPPFLWGLGFWTFSSINVKKKKKTQTVFSRRITRLYIRIKIVPFLVLSPLA